MGERDHKQRSRAAFDRQAPTYDTTGYGRHARRLHAEVVAAAESFPFTVVLDVGCIDSLHHYPDPAALREMRRVTRSGGGLVIGEWRPSAPLPGRRARPAARRTPLIRRFPRQRHGSLVAPRPISR